MERRHTGRAIRSHARTLDVLLAHGHTDTALIETDLLLGRLVLLQLALRAELVCAPPQSCRICGCTDDNCTACIQAEGHACHWVERDLCSRCVVPAAMLDEDLEGIHDPTGRQSYWPARGSTRAHPLTPTHHNPLNLNPPTDPSKG